MAGRTVVCSSGRVPQKKGLNWVLKNELNLAEKADNILAEVLAQAKAWIFAECGTFEKQVWN